MVAGPVGKAISLGVGGVNNYVQQPVPGNSPVVDYVDPTTPTLDNNLTANSETQYAKTGGTIHIKPENKGKFNATKARTGKTTEELTHSSNPVTRKRAIFAQNAAKWHHATGGPIDSPYKLTVTADPGFNSTATINPNIVPNVKTVLPDLMGDAIKEASAAGGFKGTSRKVHGSKDRYREMETGGLVANKVAPFKKWQYAEFDKGGDIPLNSDAFQVKGNPQTTDANEYNMGGTPVALDHNEVVKGNFVFSDSITNPLTGNKFSVDAKPIQKSIGKAEKKINLYGDLLSRNTAKHQEALSNDLQKVHEYVATAQGHRNPDGSTKQKMEFGGLFSKYNNAENLMYESGGLTPGTIDWMRRSYDQYTQTPYPEEMPARNRAWVDALGKVHQADDALVTQPVVQNGIVPGGNDYLADLNNQQPDLPTDTTVQNPAPQLQLGTNLTPSVYTKPTMPTVIGTPQRKGYQTPFTVGDALQGVEVGTKLWRALGPSEVEPTRQLNAPITQQNYDSSVPLYNSNRQYQTALNSYSGSLNTRRAVAANLLSTKLAEDNNIIAKYQDMNNTAKIQYQDRLAQRQGQNIALQQYSADVNSRNRAAKQNMIDSALTGIGNFGQALNQKVVANDTMRIFSKLYPQTYKGIEDALSYEDYLKFKKRGNQ